MPPGRDGSGRELRRKIFDAAFDVGEKAVEDGWSAAVADQLAEVLNERLWEELQRRRGDRRFCERLSTTAAYLDQAADGPKTLLGKAAAFVAKLMGRSSLEQRLAKALAGQVADKVAAVAGWPTYKFKLTARLLRICGVWVCVDAGLTLRDCECFKDLASDSTKEYIKGVLEEKIDILVVGAGPK
ncbi:hypothetical protein ACQEVB_01710 [Pseudonocardia sp. CA-107938]|uniref:hypothetical protein n=1 Tax=Pseudonocardia sp. CA-107938 TaxID=3240021 RepID=UPI003D8D95B9